MTSPEYYAVLFDSVQHAMKAEKIFKKADISFKLIPVPKHISSNCGICIRFTEDSMKEIQSALSSNIDYSEIAKL